MTYEPTPISSLVDAPVKYDLGESTCPPLALADIADPTVLADLALGYGTTRGGEQLRSLIADEAGVAADEVLLTAGAMHGLLLLAQEFAGHVVVVGPYFPPARVQPTGFGSHVDVVNRSFESGFRLDVDRVLDALTPETRLVSLASPQNPTGVRLTDDELGALLDGVERRAPQAVVLVDEIYRESTYGDAPVPRSVAAASPRVVTCSSLSKAHGAPGLRVGWLTVRDQELYERLQHAKFLSNIACSTVDEYLAAEVLRRRGELLPPRAHRLREALDQLAAWAPAQPVEWVRPDGGAMCCLRLRADATPAIPAFYQRLAERDVRVAPGSWFGADDRMFRVGFGHLEAVDFTEALARLSDALRA